MEGLVGGGGGDACWCPGAAGELGKKLAVALWPGDSRPGPFFFLQVACGNSDNDKGIYGSKCMEGTSVASVYLSLSQTTFGV